MLTDGRPKRLLLISPQPWEGMQLSKHHYARALAKQGHRVDFVEPPQRAGRPGAVTVTKADDPGIRIVRYRPWFPYRLKFHARALFDAAMRVQARMIARATGGAPDIVWDFDNAYQFADLRAFGAPVRLFHAVDQIVAGVSGSKHAQLVVAIDDALIDRLGARDMPHLIVPHGLNPIHLAYARRVASGHVGAPRAAGSPVRIGYVGNLLMPALDRDAIMRLVDAHRDATFDFVTPLAPDSLANGADAKWLRALAARANCCLHIGRGPGYIVDLADRIDIWLICYDLARDINAGSNSHKMLEYLATGAPVLTSWLRPYVGNALVTMADRGDNSRLPELLSGLIADLAAQSAPERRIERATFAITHDYAHHIGRISDALTIACGHES